MARATPFDNFAGFEVDWRTFTEHKRSGEVITFEVPVISICALIPCGRCYQCGLAVARRMIMREQGKL